MEIHIIVALSVALSLTLLILLFVTWKDRNGHSKLETLETQISELKNLVVNTKIVGQARSKAFQTQISELKNSVDTLQQGNQKSALKDVFAEIVLQEINVLLDIASRADELQVETEGMKQLLKQLPTPIAFKNPPPNLPQYNAYWRDLSRWIRGEKQWTCEKCCVNLENRHRDLHVHHIFGRGFNSPQHLMVLCIACHAEQPGHAFMKAHSEYKAFLRWKNEVYND